MALVSVDGLYSYIDRNGNDVVEPLFVFATSFQNGFAFVLTLEKARSEEMGGYALINKNGNIITKEDLVYDNGGGYTFISEWSTGFVGDLARVAIMVDGSIQFAYIDKNGEIVWE